MKTQNFLYYFVLALVMLLWACTSTRSDAMPAGGSVATEHWIRTQNAMTREVLPILTPTLTPTQPFAHLPTLTPIPNSTPVGNGASIDVPSDVLGPKYEIQNAYYFDTLEGKERYEIYAGAIAGSGDEYTAQGVVVVHILRVTEQSGNPYVELVEMREYLTSRKAGSLRLDDSGYYGSWLLLINSLRFVWALDPINGEFFPDLSLPPLARLEIGETTQVAKVKGDSSVFSTNPLPLTGRSPFVARLYLPLEQPPDALSLSAILVSPPGVLQYDDLVTEDRAEWRTDCPLCTPPVFRDSMDLGKLLLLRDQTLRLSLEPGFYGLFVHASWLDAERFGRISATYSYLIEVQE